MARPLVSEPVRLSDPESDLNSEDLSAKIEAKVREEVKLLNSEVLSVRPETRVNELVSVLNREFFSARLEAIVIEPVGIRVQLVATPACSVQETGEVLEA